MPWLVPATSDVAPTDITPSAARPPPPPAGAFRGGAWAKERHGAEMIQVDPPSPRPRPAALTAANIDYEDAQGRFADFHALRHTFISNLARAGVHPRNAQALARHSTIDLTMNVYTHVAMNDLHADVESLPGLGGGGKNHRKAECEAAAPTPAVPAESPAELAGLISVWKDLPDNVRSAIAALAGA